MRHLSTLFVCLLLAIGSLALASASDPQVREEAITWAQAAPTDGDTLYLELCAVCHGTDGRGEGPAAAALVLEVPDLTRLALDNAGEFPTGQVEVAIAGRDRLPAAHGSVEMPIWGHVFRDLRPDRKPYQREGLATARIRNLTRYLESLQVSEPAAD